MKYSTALSGHLPGTATDLLRHRITTGRKTTDSIVDWMESFAKVNETYAAEMERMLRRISISDGDLGTLATAWNGCASMAVEIARLSSMLGSRVRVEVKQPLVDFMETGWGPAEHALSSVVRSDRIDEARVDDIQRADLNRLVTIKESLLKFQTMVADEGQGVSHASEKGLRELLAFEPQDEIESYVAQVVAGAAVAEPAGSHRSASAATAPHTSRRHASLQSLRSSHTTNDDGKAATGIRAKVGSIFGRRKNKQKDTELRRTASASSSFREEPEYRPPAVNSDPLPARTAAGRDDAAYGARTAPEPTSNGRAPAPAPPPQRINQSADHLPPNNPTVLHRAPQDSPFRYPIMAQDTPPTASQEELAGLAVNGPPASTRRRRDIQSALFTGVEPAQRESMVAPKTAVTPLNGSPEQEEFFTPAQQFSATFDAPRAAPAFQPVLEETSPAVPSQPVFTSAAASIPPPTSRSQAGSAPAPAPAPAPAAPLSAAPLAAAAPSLAAPVAAPLATAGASADLPTTSMASLASEDSLGHAPNFSRSGSGRRSAGLQRAFTGDVTSSHPAAPAVQGLVVTIKENLTARVVDGHITEATVTGEINGLCNGAPVHTLVRLAGSDAAQSVVPNAPYMSPAALGGGLYDVDAATFAHQTVTLAKYTVPAVRQVPIVFTPAWRIEDHQARLMLSYSLPDSYPTDSVVLDNLVVAVMVTGGHATAAQSKPIATFSQEKQRVTWRFAKPVELRRGQVQRLLCQLSTDSRVEEAPNGVEVRFSTTSTPPALEPLLQRPDTGEWLAVPANTELFVHRYSASSI